MINFSLGVDMMLLNKHFAVVTVAVGVVVVPANSKLLSATVMRVLCVSALFGRISHTILGYVTLFV